MPTPKRGTSIERENPFRPGGEIEKEVDVILRSSTISADTITIVDPSSPQYKKSNNVFDAPDGEDCDSEHDNNEQVVVSVNSQDITDSNENIRDNKQTSAAAVETNGHTTEETEKVETLDKTKNPKAKKKKNKPKKTCQII